MFLIVSTNQNLNIYDVTLKIPTMENIVPNINNQALSDLLFNSYYDSSYSDSSLLFNDDSYHNSSLSSNPPIFELSHLPHDSPSNRILELYDDPSHDFSDLFLEEFDLTQIGNEMIEREYEDEEENEIEREFIEECDNSEYEDEEEKELRLHPEMEFKTWELAESYLKEYAKQQGFCFCKRRRIADLINNTITRRRTYECSHAYTHEAQKAILEENRRDRDSEMIGCSWHINFSFPKSASGVRITSILGEHNHDMNPLVTEIAPKFRKLTDEMLEKIKFWTIQGRMSMLTQYNLLEALFPDKIINKKDLSNAIQQF